MGYKRVFQVAKQILLDGVKSVLEHELDSKNRYVYKKCTYLFFI